MIGRPDAANDLRTRVTGRSVGSSIISRECIEDKSGEKVRRLRIAAYFGKPTVSQRFRLSDTQPNIKLAQMPVKTGNVARRHLATRDDNQLKDF
ncbi:hypothetical protein DXM26_18415 [Agrobacterium tumefaciens]|jgi:hypothetical protein|nr:hypothetical protein DXM26_18415 [Agrobacterium tumefaciens]